MSKYCFGIDVGGTAIKCALFSCEGMLLDKWEIKTNTENNGERILPDIAGEIQAKLREKSIEKSEVKGIGIGFPGPIEEIGEITCAENLNWGRKNVVKELEQLTEIKVKAENDANLAALGEMWKGSGAGIKNLILVTLGTGVGAGIVVKEKIFTGAHGAGGEVGHILVNPHEKEVCSCGSKGCLEQYVSARGITKLAKEALLSSEKESLLRNMEEVTAKTVFDAYKKQDALAGEIIEKFAGYLGQVLAVFACVTDPDVILIGGGVSKAGESLTECVKQQYEKYAFSTCKKTPIKLAVLGNDAGIYGAAKLILSEQ